MAEILKGAAVASHIRETIIEKIEMCRLKGVNPKVAIVRVGQRSDDIAYENRVIKNCEKVGLTQQVYEFPEDISQEDFEKGLKAVNDDPQVDGILVFRPLPKHLDEDKICRMVSPLKDIDCMNPDNLSKLFIGEKGGFAPCTPEAVVEILKYYGVKLQGANAVVVNRSMVLGKPLSLLLLKENATVTVAHSKTEDMQKLTAGADIVVTGVGRAGFFGKEYFSEKNTVIDVGINFADGKMTGDVAFDEAEQVVKAITPVPGGVGAVTSMILLKHAADSAWRRANE